MIKLSTGHELEWVVAAGSLGWDGWGWPHERILTRLGIIDRQLFTVVTKSITVEPHAGKKWAVLPIRYGVWNSQGLPNKGLDWWIDKYADKLYYVFPTVLSLAYSDVSPISAIHRINDLRIKAVELNLSCPNTIGYLDFQQIFGWADTVRHHCTKPVIIKLNVAQVEKLLLPSSKYYLDFLVNCCNIVSLNSVPAYYYTATKTRYIPYSGGAYSGKLAQTMNWWAARTLRALGFKVIWPSVWSYSDVVHLKQVEQADAVSFGSIHMLRPWKPTNYVQRYIKEEYDSLVSRFTGGR